MESSSGGKHRLEAGQGPRKFKKRKTKPIASGSAEDVLLSEVAAVIRAHDTSKGQGQEIAETDGSERAGSQFDEVIIDVLELTSGG